MKDDGIREQLGRQATVVAERNHAANKIRKCFQEVVRMASKGQASYTSTLVVEKAVSKFAG